MIWNDDLHFSVKDVQIKNQSNGVSYGLSMFCKIFLISYAPDKNIIVLDIVQSVGDQTS